MNILGFSRGILMKISTHFLIIIVYALICFFSKVSCAMVLMSCNGSVVLSSKRYNEVAYATTHNGQSFKESFVHNQDKTIMQQLESGIRAIKIPLWYGCDIDGNKVVCACHGMSKSLLYCKYEEQLVKRVPCIFRTKAKRIVHEVAPAMKVLRDALRVAYGEHDGQHGLIPFPHGMFDPACQQFRNICSEVRAFLDSHPYEIVTLILEDFTNNIPLIATDIQESGLFKYVHTQLNDQPWPTLATLVTSGKRMVIFVRSNDAEQLNRYQWLAPLCDYAWDTRFDFSRRGDFKRDQVPNRGHQAFAQRHTNPRNKIFIVYHFITPFAGGSKKWAMRVNRGSVLKRRLDKLAQQTGHIPNFVQVDFFEYPHNDIFKVINALNGVA
jgi:hypothetical protein